MINQQLLDYIKQQLQQGVSKEAIKNALMASGWQAQDIEEGLNATNPSAPLEQYSNFPTKAPMKIWKILTASLVGLVIIGGGVYFATQKLFKSEEKLELPNKQTQQSPAQETPIVATVLDCKQDLKCLIQASINCEPAKVVNTITIDIFGVKQTNTSFFEIKGSEIDKCTFYLRTEKIDLVFPANIPQEVVNQQKEIYKKLEGREGTCKFNTSDLTEVLTRWEKGNFSSGNISCKLTPSGNVCETEGGDFEVAECQGTYFEQLSL